MKTVRTLIGKVHKGKGRGKKLGYPTANIEVDETAPDGIYLGYVRVAGNRRPALIFIGAAVTFEESQRWAEANILDFEGEIYDTEIRLELLEKIRDSRKFVSEAEMLGQIRQDERIARTYFNL